MFLVSEYIRNQDLITVPITVNFRLPIRHIYIYLFELFFVIWGVSLLFVLLTIKSEKTKRIRTQRFSIIMLIATVLMYISCYVWGYYPITDYHDRI